MTVEVVQFINSAEFLESIGIGEGDLSPITTGFFPFSPRITDFCLFAGLEATAPESPSFPVVMSLIRRGAIDTLHTYGDFDGGAPFHRKHAERVVAALGTDLPTIWTNHGNSHNTQSIGPGGSHHGGDDPQSDSYHLDLMPKNRTFYFSGSEYAAEPVSLRALHSASSWRSPKAVAADQYTLLRGYTSETLRRVQLRDGRKAFAFPRVRCTGPFAPNLSTLGLQVERVNREIRRSKWRSAVIYQHLGVRIKTQLGITPADPEDFSTSAHSIRTFRELVKTHGQGHVWFTRLRTLLAYARVVGASTANLQSSSMHVCIPDTLHSEVSALVEANVALSVRVEAKHLRLLTVNGAEVRWWESGRDWDGSRVVSFLPNVQGAPHA